PISFASKHLQHRLRAGNPQCIRGGFHAVFGLLNFFVGSFHGQRRRVCSQLGLHHSALRPRVGNRHSVIIFMNHLPHTPTNACRRWKVLIFSSSREVFSVFLSEFLAYCCVRI